MTEIVDRTRRQSASMVVSQLQMMVQVTNCGNGREMGMHGVGGDGKGWEMGDGRWSMVDRWRSGGGVVCGCGGVSGDGEW